MKKYKNYFHKKNSILKERRLLARRRVRKLKLNPTKSETIFRKKLDRWGYKYVFQKAFFNEWYFLISDFYLPKHKTVVEIDGSHHYEDILQKAKDFKHDQFLDSKGIKVIRLKNEEAQKIWKRQFKKLLKS